MVASGKETSTCIILTDRFTVSTQDSYNFYYSYCVETGLYGLIYESEITTLVAADFAPDFEFHSEIFNTDYELYSELYEQWAYYPSFSTTDLYEMCIDEEPSSED